MTDLSWHTAPPTDRALVYARQAALACGVAFFAGAGIGGALARKAVR